MNLFRTLHLLMSFSKKNYFDSILIDWIWKHPKIRLLKRICFFWIYPWNSSQKFKQRMQFAFCSVWLFSCACVFVRLQILWPWTSYSVCWILHDETNAIHEKKTAREKKQFPIQNGQDSQVIKHVFSCQFPSLHIFLINQANGLRGISSG